MELKGILPQQANDLDWAVLWPAGSLAPLAGQKVRLRAHLDRQDHVEPRLYALYVGPAAA